MKNIVKSYLNSGVPRFQMTASEQASSEKARASKPEYEQGKFWYNVYGHVRIPVQGATCLSQDTSCQPDLVTFKLDQRLVEAAQTALRFLTVRAVA